ncbi:MAG: hypothetical protein H6739_24325 [Alphaproteobacteria bacterium]|nr:hypothetical protein [Alphaproteobacteria bacterium]
MFAWLALIHLAQAAPCPDPIAQVDAAERAALAYLNAPFDEASAEAVRALGCAELDDQTFRVTLARLMNAWGMRAVSGGEEFLAPAWYAAAQRMAPGVWHPDYPDKLRAMYDDAAAAPLGAGTLVLEPSPPEGEARVDGIPVALPARLAAGPHLIEVRAPDKPARYVDIVFVPDGAQLVVKVPKAASTAPSPTVPPPVAASPSPPDVAPQAGRRLGFVASASAAAGIGALVRDGAPTPPGGLGVDLALGPALWLRDALAVEWVVGYRGLWSGGAPQTLQLAWTGLGATATRGRLGVGIAGEYGFAAAQVTGEDGAPREGRGTVGGVSARGRLRLAELGRAAVSVELRAGVHAGPGGGWLWGTPGVTISRR